MDRPSKQQLIAVYMKTMEAVQNGFYTAEDGTEVRLNDDREMQENSRFYTHKFTVNDIPAYNESTEIEVINTDSISAGKQLLDDGYNPIVLNFASAKHAGGGVLNGSRAQEESLFRQTNLFRSLYQFTPNAENFGLKQNRRQYPMDRNFGGIYTPYATVFRGGDRQGNPFLKHPFRLSFVSVAAVNHPQLSDENHLAPNEVVVTKNKIRTILRIGLIHGHDAIVLGAFGCGAFGNPPRHIAELFKETINEKEFKNKYRKIVFAVIDDLNSGRDGNYQPFKEVFS